MNETAQKELWNIPLKTTAELQYLSCQARVQERVEANKDRPTTHVKTEEA
jgi:hypothetical protein